MIRSCMSRMKQWSPATRVFLGSSLLLITYYEYQIYRKHLPEGITAVRYATVAALLPSNAMSYVMGRVSELRVPMWMRPVVFGTYARLCGCKLVEAERPEFKQYTTLNDFFTRKLRNGSRKIDKKAAVVSPVDGLILNVGKLADLRQFPEQIKGRKFALSDLFPLKAFLSLQQRLLQNDSCVYYATIYLAPGDYHRFHSPTEWTIEHSQLISGERIPVAPWMMRWLPGLIALNVRHALIGTWRPPPTTSYFSTSTNQFFAMIPVGALNVSSIIIDKKAGSQCKRGEEVGYFRLGSTVVLVFTAKRDTKLEWKVQPGQSVLLGQPLIMHSP